MTASVYQIADRGSREIEFHDFSGRVKEGIDAGAVLELLGVEPARRLSELAGPETSGISEGLEFVKAKDDKGSRVYRVWLDLGQGREELFIKSFRQAESARIMVRRMFSGKGLRRPFHYPEKLAKMLFEGSLARRCWIAAAAGQENGIPAAEHLLYLTRGRGWTREEVLVCRGIHPRSAPDARQFFDRNFRTPNSPAKRKLKRELISSLGALLRQVRKSAIRFQDFKLHNLVLEEPPGLPPRYFVVDLSEAEINRPDYPEAVFLDRFAQSLPPSPIFTAADRLRLLRAYLAVGNDPRNPRDLCAQIQQRAKARGRL